MSTEANTFLEINEMKNIFNYIFSFTFQSHFQSKFSIHKKLDKNVKSLK